MRRGVGNRLRIPASLVWTVEDWRDFYFTLKRFRARLLRRHGLDEQGRPAE